jgi:hypothetical protein
MSKTDGGGREGTGGRNEKGQFMCISKKVYFSENSI